MRWALPAKEESENGQLRLEAGMTAAVLAAVIDISNDDQFKQSTTTHTTTTRTTATANM